MAIDIEALKRKYTNLDQPAQDVPPPSPAVDVAELKARYAPPVAQEQTPAPAEAVDLAELRAKYTPTEAPAEPAITDQPTPALDRIRATSGLSPTEREQVAVRTRPRGMQQQQPQTTNIGEALRKTQDELRTLPEGDPRREIAQNRFDKIMNIKETERKGGVAAGEAQATTERWAGLQNQAQNTIGGLTLGLSDIVLEKMRKHYGVEYTPQSTPEQLANSMGRMLGGVFSAMGLAKGMGNLTSKLGVEGTKAILLTRMSTAGISASVNALSSVATGKRSAKDASIDIGQNVAASLLGFGAEHVPGKVKNWVSQVATDLVFDIITDKARGRMDDQSFKDWFIKEELPQLAMSIGFATKDLTDKNFETNRQASVNEIKQGVIKRFKKAEADGTIAPKTELPETDLSGVEFFRGGDPIDPTKVSERGISITRSRSLADAFVSANRTKSGQVVEELRLRPEAKVATPDDIPAKLVSNLKDGLEQHNTGGPLEALETAETAIVSWASKQGYDAVDLARLGDIDEVRVINPKMLASPDEIELSKLETQADQEPSTGAEALKKDAEIPGVVKDRLPLIESGKVEDGADATPEANRAKVESMGYHEVYKLAKNAGIVTDKSTNADKNINNMLDALMEGDFGRTLKDANLAIPSDKEGIRTYIAEYLIERQATLEARTWERARQDAEKNIESEGGNEEALNRIANGRGREGDTGVMETKQVLSDENISRRFLEGDEATIAKVQAVTQAHYKRGTDIARELAARRDTWESPEGRKTLLLEVLLGGSKGQISRKESLRRQARAKDIMASLKDDEGIDLSKISDEQLTNDKQFMQLLAKIGPKTSSFRQKFMEFRRFALLSGLKTHEVNIIGNSLRSAWEITGQRGVELMLGKLTGASKRMKGELNTVKTDFVNKIKDLDRQIAESTNPVVKRNLTNAKKELSNQRHRDEGQILEALPATAKSTLAAWRGMAQASSRAFKMGLDALFTDQPIAKGDVQADPGSFAAIGGKTGYLIRFSQRALNSADIIASEVIRGGLTADFAVREAQAKGITSVEQMTKYVENSIKNPESAPSKKAEKEALRLTFREKPGDIASWVLKQRNKPGAVGVAAEMLFPFVTTPASLVKQGVRATPLGSIALARRLRADIKRKGAKQAFSSDEAIKRGSEQMVAMALTGALMAMMNDKDEQGRPRITFSMPPDATPEERDFLYKNQPPQSIRVKGTDGVERWRSYARIEPLATTLTTVGDSISALQGVPDAVTGKKDVGDVGRDMIKAVTGPFRNKTFLKAMGEIIEALSGENRGRSLIDVVNNQISSLMPNIARSTIRAGQDTFQERRARRKPKEGLGGFARSQARQIATQAIPAKTPFTNNVRIDHWGNPINRQTPNGATDGDGFTIPKFMYRLLSPSEIQETGIATPIDMAILSWNAEADKGSAYWPTRLSDLKVIGDKNSRMTDDEFEQYARTRGEYAKQMFGSWSPEDPANPTMHDIQRIKLTFTKAGQIAKARLFGTDIRDIKIEQRDSILRGESR